MYRLIVGNMDRRDHIRRQRTAFPATGSERRLGSRSSFVVPEALYFAPNVFMKLSQESLLEKQRNRDKCELGLHALLE